MRERSFYVEVVSPQRVVYRSGEVISLIAPGVEGYLGIMSNHAPIIVQLGIGVLTLRLSNGDIVRVAVSGGFLEASRNRVTVICDTAEKDEEIDVERARKAYERATARLLDITNRSIDRERARRAKERAVARLKAAGALGEP
ncbi:MAG: ATP synthase F1 subunit epsilon [Armatimonadota bacterium]|nr:ATP synthase F1 subunit epsilon [Armatimonadota bacterium]MCX7776556.1 ATP synthase F1 subunit epsilon [Armatimonadota bacterium]MDW8026110.1 ATP synthase F1 subunit epsilon [Armatimonadota bacterium]